MAISIHTNLMAGNAARTLGAHYGRLSKSVQRLSSGLRINSAADDAAGLAIRELMRADVASLNQGIRNANDAISMIQTADGALAVIDEKLIRMKELAEQAATGTYNSTQRLIIDSEYQAMAAEIDRIANATDFNGIKLLDGSLSGTHNGKGLNSTGAMKIHFGTGNASAEDYYYVEIGNCTAGALGLGHSSLNRADSIEVEKVETWGQFPLAFKPQKTYAQYEDPDTGKVYLFDGNIYFENIQHPARTRLDWEKDGEIIKRLRRMQDQVVSYKRYSAYSDPVENREYYTQNGRDFTSDPYDSSAWLDPQDASQKAIIDRLQNINKEVQMNFVWKIFEDSQGAKYYSYNGGNTYVPNYVFPDRDVLSRENPTDSAIIAGFKPVMSNYNAGEAITWVDYVEYVDKTTSEKYYSSDNGKTFVEDIYNAAATKLDPVRDKAIINRLELSRENKDVAIKYEIYLMDGSARQKYYTRDSGKTFIADLARPDEIAFSRSDPGDAGAIARLVPDFKKKDGLTTCDVYEDSSNKQYYTKDNGATFFSDLSDPSGSSFSAGDPAYSGLVGSLNLVSSTVNLITVYDTYRNPDTNAQYYSCDGGKTFVSNPDDPQHSTLDPSQSYVPDLIAKLVPVCNESSVIVNVKGYIDPVTGTIYYNHPETDGLYIDVFNNVALNESLATDLTIINRLQDAIQKRSVSVHTPYPDEFIVYENPATGGWYYSYDEGKTFTTRPDLPYQENYYLDPSVQSSKDIIDNLRPLVTFGRKIEYIEHTVQGGAPAAGFTISTQEAAQQSLVAIDNAIVSKDKIRAHLGALQNRLENTVTNLSVQAENMQASESRISDTDVATEMTAFVRNQILTESATAMLSQANSFPHMLMNLLG